MTFKINLDGLCERECFIEASREELRVLLALSAIGGVLASEEELARLAGVSVARCRASLVLWQESGVISEGEGDVIIDEFKERRDSSKRYDKPSREVAASVRDGELAAFLEECGRMMEIPALNTEEIKDLEYIVTDLGVSTEYVLVLLAHLVERRNSVTPRTLVREVESLIKNKINTVEELEIHIKRLEATTKEEIEFKLKFDYHRTLSPSEKKYINKWFNELGFTIEIIFASYGAATKTASPNIPYSRMDRILTAWHEAGCTTVAECLDRGEAYRAEKEAKQFAAEKEKRDAELAAARGSKPKVESSGKAKYNDFDTEDALMAALERSYGTPDGDKK